MFRDDYLMISSYFPSSSSSSSSFRSPWSRSQDKLFEQAIAIFPDGTSDRWRKIAGHVPGKTAWEIKEHYDDLVYDVSEIDSGRVELPRYDDDYYDGGGDELVLKNWVSEKVSNEISFGSKKSSKHSEMERKKGVPWTEDEHKLFLIGLQRYGKGDWRSISRNAVVSRTPTQVASHAQKYYLRLNSLKKEKKRSSIHDITTVDDTSCSSVAPPLLQHQSGVEVGTLSDISKTAMGPPKSIQGHRSSF